MVSITDRNESGVLLPIPSGEDRIFRNQAMDDILELLYRNPHEEFGVRQLRDVTGHGAQTVDTALALFTQIDLIQTRREGNRKLVSINRKKVRKPDDPIFEIPQEEFRTPVKALLDEIIERHEDNLAGVVLFGSVARGEADRTSDIDLFVVVEDDLLPSRRAIHEIRKQIENSRFDGDRYDLQVMIESVETANQYGEKLQEIFSEGITLYDSDQLRKLRRVALNG